jgi:hypothetical protein
MPKCIYCKVALHDESVFDVCRPCGLQVWGENMYNAIVGNMEAARDKGDLYQGSVTEQPVRDEHAPPKGIHAPSGFNPPSPTSHSPGIQPQTPNLGNPLGLSLVDDAISRLKENSNTSTLDGMPETELLPQANDLVEETPFIIDTSKSGF